MTSASTPAPVVSVEDMRSELIRAMKFVIGPASAAKAADAILSGPLAEMQAEHQAEVERWRSIARRWLALDAGAWHQGRYLREKAELEADTRASLEAQLAQYQTASRKEPNNVVG